MKPTVSFAAFVVATLVAGAANAYVIDNDGNGHSLHWKSMPVRYRMVAGNAPGGASGEEAVKRAFNSWSSASGNVSYVFDGYGQERNEYDSRNMVYWIRGGWPYDQTALAVTARYFSRKDGSLLDADILFNGERYVWSVGGAGYDIENAAAHEVGHLGGLGHSTDFDATMHGSASPGETKKRSLNGDDVAGLAAIYGSSGASGGAPQPSGVGASAAGVSSGSGGGCSIGTADRTNPGDLAWLGALLGGLLLRRRTRGWRGGATDPSRIPPSLTAPASLRA